jgi:hypothetical protein
MTMNHRSGLSFAKWREALNAYCDKRGWKRFPVAAAREAYDAGALPATAAEFVYGGGLAEKAKR